MAIIAEGIETRGELEMLRSLGVKYGQGYFLGRPAAPPLLSLVVQSCHSFREDELA